MNDRKTREPDFFLATGEPCPHPAKTAFRSRREARYALRLLKPKFNTTRGLPKPYRCSCGAWHLGHPPDGRRLPPALR